jgi:hypothetical protein
VRPADLCSCGRVKPADRRGEVDIVVKLSTLIGLDNDPAMMSGFGPVIADIARQAALEEQTNPRWKWSLTDEHGLLLHHGHTQRRPTTAEADFVRARDRVCKTRGCRRPAAKCDLDHRVEYAKGGPSHRANLGPNCPRHHPMREEHGYQVTYDPQTGVHTWIAPDGRVYHVGPDDDLSLTADHDNPDPSLYRQMPLPGTTADEATPGGHKDTDDGKDVADHNKPDDATQAMLDALIRKYGKEAA